MPEHIWSNNITRAVYNYFQPQHGAGWDLERIESEIREEVNQRGSGFLYFAADAWLSQINWSELADYIKEQTQDTPETTPDDEPPTHRFVFESLQFFEIEAPAGSDPDALLRDPDTIKHFGELVTGGFIDFKHERTTDDNGEEI